MTTARDLCPAGRDGGTQGMHATPCLAAGISEPPNQHLQPQQGQGLWEPSHGEQNPQHRCLKAIPKPCPKEHSRGGSGFISQPQNCLLSPSVPACSQGKGPYESAGRAPSIPRTFPSLSQGLMPFDPPGQGESCIPHPAPSWVPAASLPAANPCRWEVFYLP